MIKFLGKEDDEPLQQAIHKYFNEGIAQVKQFRESHDLVINFVDNEPENEDDAGKVYPLKFVVTCNLSQMDGKARQASAGLQVRKDSIQFFNHQMKKKISFDIQNMKDYFCNSK